MLPDYQAPCFLRQVRTPIHSLNYLQFRFKKLAKRRAHQLDFDKEIYTQMATEAEAGKNEQNKPPSDLPDSRQKRPRVTFALIMGQERPTTSNQPHTVGNQQLMSKNKKRRLRREKGREPAKTNAPPQSRATRNQQIRGPDRRLLSTAENRNKPITPITSS